MQEHSKGSKVPIKFKTSTKSSWVVPTSKDELTKVINESDSFKVVAGGTSEEFWKSVTENPQTIIDVSKVKEMRCVELMDSHLRLGASLTIDEMQKELKIATTKLAGMIRSEIKIGNT